MRTSRRITELQLLELCEREGYGAIDRPEGAATRNTSTEPVNGEPALSDGGIPSQPRADQRGIETGRVFVRCVCGPNFGEGV